MSEKRFRYDSSLEKVYDDNTYDGETTESRFECVFVEDKFGGTSRRLKDNETNITYMTCDVADLLNFQNTQIKILKEQNEILIKQNDIIEKFLCHRGLTDEEWRFMRRLEKELFDDE